MFSRKITRKVFNRSGIRTVLLFKKKFTWSSFSDGGQ